MSTTCHLPWTQAFVNANGTMSPCCAPLELGHLDDTPIAAIFDGPRYAELRDALFNERSTPLTSWCDNCYLRKKHSEAGYDFDVAYRIGADTEESLSAIANDHPAFVENYRRLRAAYIAGEPLAPGTYPLRLEVQIGEHCDLRCIMCWQDHKRPMALGDDALESLVAVMPYALDVVFTGGEPTIFNTFWKLVDRFRETSIPQARLQFLTHSLHLADNIHRFEGINHLGFCINVDGPTEATYERIRNRGRWNELNRNLEAVAKACKTHPGWGMNLTFLLMRSNIELIEESFAMCNRYNAGWSCGIIAGEYTPIAQCRAYFEENIFRFGHLGYSKGRIDDILKGALAKVDMLTAPTAAANASATLRATISQARETIQLDVPKALADTMLAELDGHKLSMSIQKLVVAGNEGGVEDLNLLRHSLLRAEDGYGRQSCEYGEVSAALGAVLFNAGEPREAFPILKEALAILSCSNSVAHGKIAEVEMNLAKCEILLEIPNGIKRMAHIVEVLRAHNGASNSRTAAAELDLGQALIAAGRLGEASQNLKNAHETYKRLYGKQQFSSYVSVTADAYARTLENEAPEAAIPLLERALRIYDEHFGKKSSLSQATASRLATAMGKIGARDRADQILERYSLGGVDKRAHPHADSAEVAFAGLRSRVASLRAFLSAVKHRAILFRRT